ncbi:MAG TPA: Ig-like domain-containing protein, partial [Pirellulales bacterium]|nr:Ig-like domain-containing protein [Pirellulales bacterium]
GTGQTLSVSFAPTNATDYTTVAATATINVDQATPAITWANPAEITYGTALSSVQLDATASVPGTLTYTPVLGTVLPTGNGQTLSVSFAPDDATDYTTVAATATINVDQATPSITWANPAEISYGTTLSSTQLDAMASWAVNGSNQPVAGTYTYNPAAGEVLSVGNNQKLSVSFTPSDTTDYNSTSAAATINVSQATPAITWANPADITHGTALSSAQLDATASVPGTFTYAPALGTVLPAGTGQTLSVSFAPTNATDYTTVAATATINVDQAAPSITWANPADITYGTALSSAQLDATASVPGTFTYTPATGTVLPAGNGQTLSVSFAPTDSTDYATGKATAAINVARATPTLDLSAPGGVYNGTPFPASLTIDGITNSPGTALEGVIPTLAYYVGSSTSGTSLGPTPPTDAGTYTVVASFAGSTDYASARSSPSPFTIVPGSATIALTSSGGLAVFGQTVTFVATVETPTTPGGTVTFSDDGKPLATIPLGGSGQATLAITSLALGSHAITATYSGNADILRVQSSATALSVAPDGTRVVLVPQPVFKKRKMVSVGLKAEIEPLSPGGGLPTGMVTFELTKKHRKKLKVKTLGTTAVNGGAASLTLKPQKVLKKAITVVYSGNEDFLASQLIAPKLTKKLLKSLAQPSR